MSLVPEGNEEPTGLLNSSVVAVIPDHLRHEAALPNRQHRWVESAVPSTASPPHPRTRHRPR